MSEKHIYIYFHAQKLLKFMHSFFFLTREFLKPHPIFKSASRNSHSYFPGDMISTENRIIKRIREGRYQQCVSSEITVFHYDKILDTVINELFFFKKVDVFKEGSSENTE